MTSPPRPTLSVAIITLNEEANLPRTLESVKWADEIVVVDSGSTDKTCDVARSFGAKVFVEEWKGFAAQKNSALDKCTSDWILSLDADEEVSGELAEWISQALSASVGLSANRYIESFSQTSGYFVPRMNLFLDRHIKWGGYYPDAKLRLFKRGKGRFKEVSVHETVVLEGISGRFFRDMDDVGSVDPDLIHHAYPTLSGYIEHMNRYSSLGAEMATEKGPRSFSLINIVLRPIATFIYNYFFRLGFLDGREGLLLHLYHSVYVSWKYAKAWEHSRKA